MPAKETRGQNLARQGDRKLRRRIVIASIVFLIFATGFAGGLGLREYYAFRTLEVTSCDGVPIPLSTRRADTLGIEFFIGGWASGPIQVGIAQGPDKAAIEETVILPRPTLRRISYAFVGEWYGDFAVTLEGEECNLLLVYRFWGTPIDVSDLI